MGGIFRITGPLNLQITGFAQTANNTEFYHFLRIDYDCGDVQGYHSLIWHQTIILACQCQTIINETPRTNV